MGSSQGAEPLGAQHGFVKVMTPPAWAQAEPSRGAPGCPAPRPQQMAPLAQEGKRQMAELQACTLPSDPVCFCTCGYQAAQRPSLSSRRAVGKASTQGPHPNSGCVSCLGGWGARRIFSYMLARQPEPRRRSTQALGQVGRLHIPALQMRKQDQRGCGALLAQGHTAGRTRPASCVRLTGS